MGNTSSVNWYSFVRTLFYTRFLPNRTKGSFTLVMIIGRNPGGTGCSALTGSAVISGVSWNVGPQSNGLCMSLTTMPRNYIGELGIADINAHLIAIGRLNNNDFLIW